MTSSPAVPGVRSLGGAGWRRAAQLAASRAPDVVLRVAAPVVGLLAWALAGPERRAITGALRRARGPRGALRDAIDSARTFATHAACVTETLGAGSAGGRLPQVLIRGELHLRDALADARGLVMVTAHTAGWEAVGPLLSRDFRLEVMIAAQAEGDPAAGAIQDEARRAHGLLVARVGDDPLSALPLARHVRLGGTVALQIDRVPPGVRARPVALFGQAGTVPEGPLRLGAVTGAPVVPVFVARTGHRRYEVTVHAPLRVPRAPTEGELDLAAQAIARALEAAILARPTQWFAFDELAAART